MVKIFSTTPRIVMGPGSVKTIGTEVKARGAKRVLIVTDKGVIGAGLLKSIEDPSRLPRSKTPSSTRWSPTRATRSWRTA
jgi:alcohol dehydrogenase class IV